MNIITGTDNSSQPPPPDFSEDYRLGWAKEALVESDQWLRNQRLFDRIKRTHDMLLGVSDTLRGALGLSETQCNHLLRVFNMAAADMLNMRPYWRYETFNRSSELQVRNLGNLTTSWWFRSQSARQLGLTVKQSLISGCGVNYVRWDREKKDFVMPSRNPLDVKPVRPDSDFTSYQGCLAVIDCQEWTVNAARSMFPRYASKIVMDRDASITGLAARTSYNPPATVSAGEAAAWAEGAPNSKLGSLPVVDVFHMYVEDKSRNESGDTILMGDWDRDPKTQNLISLNHWSYEVKPGEQRYPFKRLIIFTRTCVLYDGPSPYWHGMFPFAKLTPEPFPDLWFGISPLWACLDLQTDLNKLYRGLSDHMQVLLKPPVSGDRRSMSPGELANLDPRRPGQRWLRNPGTAEMKLVEIPPLDHQFMQWYEQLLRTQMDEKAGVRNISSILSLNQMPEGDSLDKLFAEMTPESNLRSQSLETYQTEVATMQAYNITEFYDEARVFETLGEDGLTPELFDFDPGTLVPAYTNGDYAPMNQIGDAYYDPQTGVVVNKRRTDVDLRPRWVRAREQGRKFRFKVEPGTLMRSANTARQMMYMMLRNKPKPEIDWYTLMEELDVPNIGPRPPGNIKERLQQELLETAQQAMALAGPAALGGAPPMPGDQPEGRPRVYEEPPHREGDKLSTS